MTKSIYENFMDADARIVNIVHLASMCGDLDVIPDCITEALDSSYDHWSRLFPNASFEVGAVDDDDFLLQLIESETLGFMVQVATPIPEGFNFYPEKDDELVSWNASWGYCQTYWVYSDSLDDAYDQALAWPNAFFEGEKTKAREAQESAQ